MARHTFELNDNQEQGWLYLLDLVNKQREEQNQLPYASVEEFMGQTLADTGNAQFMMRAKAARQKRVDALMAAAALPEGAEQAAAIAAAMTL